jgi:hypothetical protein
MLRVSGADDVGHATPKVRIHRPGALRGCCAGVSITAADPRLDVDLLAAAMPPAFEQIGNCIFATWSVTGAAAALEHYR